MITDHTILASSSQPQPLVASKKKKKSFRNWNSQLESRYISCLSPLARTEKECHPYFEQWPRTQRLKWKLMSAAVFPEQGLKVPVGQTGMHLRSASVQGQAWFPGSGGDLASFGHYLFTNSFARSWSAVLQSFWNQTACLDSLGRGSERDANL